MEYFNDVNDHSTPQELLASLKAGFEAYSLIDHKAIESTYDRTVFCNWRQKLGSTLTWYSGFVRHRCYSSGINAAMALGKFGDVASPIFSLVNTKDLSNIQTLGDFIWQDIQRGILPD